MRIGDWKIVGSDDLTSFELYNIQNDWQETTNVAADFPNKFAELREKLIEHDAAVLEEGPDWWKLDKPRRRGSKRSSEPPVGNDSTQEFDVVLGADVSKSDFGYSMSSQTEGLALQKLSQPITESATIRLTYRSDAKSGTTRNGALVIASKPTNSDSFKIGTAIGMNQHVAFAGGWGNVGNAAAKKAAFKAGDTFEVEVRLDISKGAGTAAINGSRFQFSLPPDLKSVSYVGFYAKATATEFSAPVVE